MPLFILFVSRSCLQLFYTKNSAIATTQRKGSDVSEISGNLDGADTYGFDWDKFSNVGVRQTPYLDEILRERGHSGIIKLTFEFIPFEQAFPCEFVSSLP